MILMFKLRKSLEIYIWWSNPDFQILLSCILAMACSPPPDFHIAVG